MKNIFDLLITANNDDRPKTRILVKVIYATIAALVLSLLLLVVSLIITAVGDDMPHGDSTDTGEENRLPTGYVTDTFGENQLYSGDLVLVDNDTPLGGTSDNVIMLIAGSATRPKTDLGSNSYTIFDVRTFGGTSDAVDALNEMLGDYYVDQSGKTDDNLIISNAARIGGNSEAIYSTGLVFQLRYYEYYNNSSDNKTASIYEVAKYKWIYDNAYKYGFIRAYPDSVDADTANIFRYVGVAHSTYMKNTQLSLENYINALKTHPHTAPLSVKGADGNAYFVYYIPKNETPNVPENYSYKVSGDNSSGYIVTVFRSSVSNTPAPSMGSLG